MVELQGYPVQPPGSSNPTQNLPPAGSYPTAQQPVQPPASYTQPQQPTDLNSAPPDYAAGNNARLLPSFLIEGKLSGNPQVSSYPWVTQKKHFLKPLILG